LTIEILVGEKLRANFAWSLWIKAVSFPDENAVALRESRAAPSSVEVCLEVWQRFGISLPSTISFELQVSSFKFQV
jgi:hypothetical protein